MTLPLIWSSSAFGTSVLVGMWDMGLHAFGINQHTSFNIGWGIAWHNDSLAASIVWRVRFYFVFFSLLFSYSMIFSCLPSYLIALLGWVQPQTVSPWLSKSDSFISAVHGLLFLRPCARKLWGEQGERAGKRGSIYKEGLVKQRKILGLLFEKTVMKVKLEPAGPAGWHRW